MTRGLLEQENQQLKQQLAESEKQIKHLKGWLDDEILTSIDHESYYSTINEYEEEIKELKQQLAESEKSKEINIKERDKICLEIATDYNRQILELEQQLEEVEGQYAYECECNKQFVECQNENEKLKQQLAESKNTISNLKEANDSFSFISHYICEHLGKNDICPKDVNDFVESFAQFKQQLAEKEKEIEKYRNANIIVVGGRSQGKKHLMEIKIKELQNQKAIEQLEKVKEWCENHKSSDEYDYVIAYEPDEEDASGCVDYLKEEIDNQINELKGEIK